MYNVRRLRLLRELAARGTVTAVAEALAYTPSAVSQQLAQLERDAGVPLLERAGRGVRLTEAGRRLAAHADAIMARMAAAEADLAGLSGHASGRLRVACFQTAAGALVLPALDTLLARHPAVVPELVDIEAEEALPLLRLGEFDLVVAEEYDHAPRRRDPAFVRTELGHDRMLVALPGRHPLAVAGAADRVALSDPPGAPAAGRVALSDPPGAPAADPVALSDPPGAPAAGPVALSDPPGAPAAGPVALSDLAGDRWVTSREDTLFAAMVARACRAVGGFEPQIRHRTNDLRLLFELVATQQTVALVPALGRGWLAPGVALRPLAGPPLERRIFTAVRAGTGTHPAIQALQEALAARATELGVAAG